MQLDFIGTIKPKREVKQIQYSLWNEDYSKPNKVKSEINYSNVEKFFNQLTAEEIAAQKTYWASVTPQDCGEKFQRWLFAFMSVHTSWQSNVKGYQAIKAWTEWFNKPDALKEKLISSTVGMHNNRTRYVDEFSKAYWNAPKTFNKQQGETWVQFRNRLVEQVLGLGMAKISFGLEMCYPNEAEVVCMDTHLFQFYGLDQTTDSKHYEEIERHWIQMCKMWNVPSYIARCIYWDKKQGSTDSRYWSYCLEN